MFNLDAIVSQVQRNCNISDSRHAGLYSVCGLALRLRDLYKWEKGLDPWIERESSEILEWIASKEEQWGELLDLEFSEITIDGSTYDPFDSNGINGVLTLHGLFYGAGYVHSLKPSFFLGVLEDQRQVDGYTVYTLGRELARDLLTMPALSQENCIVVRQESAKLFLWDLILFTKKSGQQALQFGLENYGLKRRDSEALHSNLARISAAEVEIYLYHELGELRDTVFKPNIWREIIATFPHTPIELLARSVKDLLADTNKYGTLRHIVEKGKAASLGLYVAFLDGLRKELFPELFEAFKEFTNTHNWQVIEKAIATGYKTAKGYAELLSKIYHKGKVKNDMPWVEKEIEKRLLAPLGILKGE
ncbi:MAG: hypothetical protein LJE89_16615 [Deltaproteobacteria bacterium]|nr:hypothetical protein [Deltaproteobacteria bacterium]